MKKVSVLGATGSVGVNTLKIIDVISVMVMEGLILNVDHVMEMGVINVMESVMINMHIHVINAQEQEFINTLENVINVKEKE